MLFLLLLLAAQAPEPAPKAVLENTGKPMRVPFRCSDDDLHAFGLTCPPQQPCEVYLELANLEPDGKKLFLTGNLHTEAATLFSILLASEDEGATWWEPHERARGAGLDQIQFLDFDTGWVSGQALGPVAKDPFLLLTRDGGKTWRMRPIWEESRAGLIELFRFDSRTHGLLWIDRTQSGETEARYESYESMTGGENWALRESGDRPLKKPQRPPPPAGWRLRADSRTHSYRVERQAGERWVVVASFLVDAGQCKEAEPVLTPPPPPVEEPKPAEPPPAPAPKKPGQ